VPDLGHAGGGKAAGPGGVGERWRAAGSGPSPGPHSGAHRGGHGRGFPWHFTLNGGARFTPAQARHPRGPVARARRLGRPQARAAGPALRARTRPPAGAQAPLSWPSSHEAVERQRALRLGGALEHGVVEQGALAPRAQAEQDGARGHQPVHRPSAEALLCLPLLLRLLRRNDGRPPAVGGRGGGWGHEPGGCEPRGPRGAGAASKAAEPPPGQPRLAAAPRSCRACGCRAGPYLLM
jgi:hypothetical protein